MPSAPAIVAVCGASEATDTEAADAEVVGRLLAERGVTVVCGGLGGVMAAAARGVAAGRGICVGLLPGADMSGAAPELTIAIPTGMGEMRNALIARACSAMVAIGGGYGTLSEIALALRLGRPVAALHTWQLRSPSGAVDPLRAVDTPSDAVDWVMSQIARQ